ncbi:fatty acyl-AMP ligase [Tolypothrix campylonemoides VB511288]|nr:fatty acyl-AMP ligase [Tolypothrix campylonemoides VB511288]
MWGFFLFKLTFYGYSDRVLFQYLFSLTYRELDLLSGAIASYLQSMDARGKRALLIYQPSLEFIAAFFGCLYAGVIAVPAYPPRQNQSLSRLQAIVADNHQRRTQFCL